VSLIGLLVLGQMSAGVYGSCLRGIVMMQKCGVWRMIVGCCYFIYLLIVFLSTLALVYGHTHLLLYLHHSLFI